MKNIRIGNDIWFKWQILREKGVETWDGKDIKVMLRDSYGMCCAVEWRADEGGVISGVCRGRAQKRLGLYTLTLVENNGKDDMGCVDSIDAWRLVARQNASVVDEEERDGALGVGVVMLTSKVGIGTGESLTIDTELDEQSNNAIANSAVAKGINAVGEISEQDLQEVVGVGTGNVPSTKPKKRKEQIIIGRAIKPKACEIGNVDNWYVFKDCVLVNMHAFYDENVEEIPQLNLYINGEYQDYDSLVAHEVRIYSGYFTALTKNKVLSYKFDESTHTLNLYLEQKKAQDTIKGTSLIREYVNGNGIVNKECDIDKVVETLKLNIIRGKSDFQNNKIIIGGIHDYDIERKELCIRNKKVRSWRKSEYYSKYEYRLLHRFRRKFLRPCRFHAGLYRIRLRVGNKKTRWVYVYLKIKYKGFRGEAMRITYTKK